jgi:hypothetical protein
VRVCHDEAKNDAIVDDHFLCIDTGVWKDGPYPRVVSLHTVETRFDSVMAMEDDVLGIQIEVCNSATPVISATRRDGAGAEAGSAAGVGLAR